MRNLVLTALAKAASAMAAVLLAASCAGGDASLPTTSAKIAPEISVAAQALAAGRNVNPPARSNAAGYLQVYIYVATVSDEAVAAVKRQRAENVLPSPALSLIEAWVRPQDLGGIAALPFVTRIALPHYARP